METDTIRWLNAFFELFVVLAFAIGWLILEMVGRRLDRKREEERAKENNSGTTTAKPDALTATSERAPGHLEGQHGLHDR